jgi:predicted patatin/cPLA2 family phospholipase
VSPCRRPGPAGLLFLLAVAPLLLAGCGSLPRNPPPAQQVLDATVPQFPDVRAWAAKPSRVMEQDLAVSFAQESSSQFPPGPGGVVSYSHLALSGGGANGAFGAGLLNGWTSRGDRPVFKIVTGVSTGALMAPFAFVGPDYDQALREFYTTTSTRDIFIVGSFFSLVRQLVSGEALADTRPLQAMIARHVDDALLQRVADAHRRGRRLYIGTANLDAPRFVVWNMGLIATSGQPGALELFRKVMLASASIPVAFPPVFFEVELARGGPRYDEMHVDGGVGARVFLHGGVLDGATIRQRGGHGGRGKEDIYVIHNGQLVPQPDPINRTLPDIAVRVIDASGRTAAIGDLFRMYAYSQQEGVEFRWVTIPNDVPMGGDEVFDPVQMQRLYDVGYRMGASGSEWRSQPPGQRSEP